MKPRPMKELSPRYRRAIDRGIERGKSRATLRGGELPLHPAYIEGREAFAAGKPGDANPYPEPAPDHMGPSDHVRWRAGWWVASHGGTG